MLNEISQTEKDSYCMISLTCGIKKIQPTSEYNKKEADSETWRTDWRLPRGRGGGGEGWIGSLGLIDANYYIWKG